MYDGDEIKINSYTAGGLSNKDKGIYDTCVKFLERNNNEKDFKRFGFAVLSKENNQTIFHYDEGITLIMRLQPGSRLVKLESVGTDFNKRKLAAKTLLGIMGLEIQGEGISLRNNV